jgi:hypothetical protein
MGGLLLTAEDSTPTITEIWSVTQCPPASSLALLRGPRPPAEGTEHEHPLGSESDLEPVRTFFEGTDERRLTTASSDRSAESLVTSHEDSVPRDVSGRLSLPIGTDGRYDVWMRSDSWWDIDRGVRRRRAGWGGST